jgi:hypothetical protein
VWQSPLKRLTFSPSLNRCSKQLVSVQSCDAHHASATGPTRSGADGTAGDGMPWEQITLVAIMIASSLAVAAIILGRM